jgi:Ca2+-binding RTX toxin-like protein
MEATTTAAQPLPSPKPNLSKPSQVASPAPNLVGTVGADILLGGLGNDTYSAGTGDDFLVATSGNDTISGGSGYDVLDYSKVNADLSLARGGVIAKSGGLGTDTISGFDVEEIRANAQRVNTIDGSTGVTASLDVELSANRLTINGLPGIGSATLKVVNFQNVNGSQNADLIVGDDKVNVLDGKGGNDTINGGGGDDTLLGSSGSDVYRGGSGFDTLSYAGFTSAVTLVRGGTIIKADGSVDAIADFSVEAVVGAKGLANTIDGTTGTTASLSVDLLKETLTINNLPVIGSAQLAVKNFTNVLGSENADSIIGSNGSNVLSGGGGNDVLTGLRGADRLTGGTGSDVFVFGKGDSLLTGFDQITDFLIGTDVIDGFSLAGSVTQLGVVSSLSDIEVGKVLTNQLFAANSAVTFGYAGDSSERTFLALNDGRIGFQAGSDSIVEITGFSGNLNNLTVV